MTPENVSCRFVALGDVPYDPDQRKDLVRLIDRINRLRPDFTVHVGDIKEGGDPYTDEAYDEVRGLFALFDHPFLYTPGDNDWADSDKGPDKRDPLERLEKVRRTFCGADLSWPQPAGLWRQSEAGGPDGPFRENAAWTVGGVCFATIHIVSSDQNPKAGPDDVDEEREKRFEANLRWLDQAFEEAAGMTALVLITHANFWTRRTNSRAGVAKGFRPYRRLLEDRVQRFGKPVLLVHGNNHQLVIDQPLWRKPRDKTTVVGNFLRLQVFGDHQIGAVEVKIDASLDAVFSFRPMLAPEAISRTKAGASPIGHGPPAG